MALLLKMHFGPGVWIFSHFWYGNNFLAFLQALEKDFHTVASKLYGNVGISWLIDRQLSKTQHFEQK